MRLNVVTNRSLQAENTFGLEVVAERYVAVTRAEQFPKVFGAEYAGNGDTVLVLGGGSNLLLEERLPGWVVHLRTEGIEVVDETDNALTVAVEAGTNWHQLVRWSVARDLWGLENLALIPGTVGAAPIQNIGAYGSELSQVFVALRAWDRQTSQWLDLNATDCAFGYRDSVFKRELKNRAVICQVTLRLDKHPNPKLGYGNVKEELEKRFTEPYSPADVADVVESIRRAKLPDPAVMGNAGSFFKNPTLPRQKFERLTQRWPNIPHFPAGNGQVKIPAAWLIEQSGWKGKRMGAVGCHATQPLVLVNYGGATRSELWQHALRVKASVYNQFGVTLEPEVNLYPPAE